MDLINISIGQDEISHHLSIPTEDFDHSFAVSDMPELKWHRISSLGFGLEKDKESANAESESELLDYAASLFATCNQPFSILCERTVGKIVYAIGCADDNLAPRLLKSAFGTVKAENYTPEFSGSSGLYAHSFEAVRMSAEEMEKREAVSSVHMSKWADAVAKALTRHSGMVRLDFQPASPIDCDKLIDNARKLCDKITTYLESNIQTGDNISLESKDNFLETFHKQVKGDVKYNKSSNASVSWKGVSSKLSDLKKEAEYFIRLFSDSKKQGWTVEMTFSAALGKGELLAQEKDSREKALSVPLAAMLTNAGYACKWDYFGDFKAKKPERAILLPAAYATEFISFPTISFFGFERVKNCYYNVNLPYSDNAVPFADLMQYEETTGIELSLPKKEMNRHTFICGMTGSGKTNTVHHLLSSIGDFPYLVIEPVKGEYHSLPGIKAYTMTAGSNKSLCLNPFWFPKGSSLQYHIDYLKQIISSAFDLYAAMPNILEQCLVLVYQHCGWDFIQNENRYASELPESMLYPTFSDLCREVDTYLDNAKFGDELKGNYRGALLSRLQSFTNGPKGMLLNTSQHLPCDELSEGKVVISLDSLADDADKSIVMGVIIAQYYEYLKTKCIGSTKKDLQHIVVIEEAHHLFAGDTTASASSGEGGSGQNSSQELVKTLNNMLAEIRAYGEGFIIVDQSPSALHPSVLKNTGIKVAHRIDYGKDIEAMQDVLLLDKDDRELATLCPGQALVHYGGMRTSAKVQVPQCNSKEESVIIEREEISGNSVVSTLLEDSKLSTYINSAIIDRIINHLLYDELDNCKEIYLFLCKAIKTAMIKYGHSELVAKLTEGPLMAEYIATMIPARLENLFPHQYCTCKMVCMFAEKFLTIASETNGELSKAELQAFISYRENKLEPRILEFYEYTNIEEYEKARASVGITVDLNLVCNVTADLIWLKVTPENFGNKLVYLLLGNYFLCMPKHFDMHATRIMEWWSCKREEERREEKPET